MKKVIIGTILVSVFALLAGVIFFSSKTNDANPAITIEPPQNLEYYWGNGCPHCAIVDEFLGNWEHTDKLEVEKFETWYSAENAKKLEAVGAYCGITKNNLGVPLLFTTEGKCLVGDEPIIKFFKELKFD